MRGSPFSPLFLLFIAILGSLLLLVQFGFINIAFQKLGLSPMAGLLILMAVVVGSGINIPMFRIQASQPQQQAAHWLQRYQLLRPHPTDFFGFTTIAVNVGGCLIPVMLSVALIYHSTLEAWQILLAISIVTMIAYLYSRPMPGLGIGMPLFIAPLTAVVIASLLNPEQRGALAYISGTLGVLIGADLMRLQDIRSLGTPVASIGGAGTFDGIFLTGVVAVLLA
jgi:uncharacterized membrane protein